MKMKKSAKQYFYLFYREIGRNLIIPGGTRTIDARGKYIMPGELFVCLR